MHEFLQRFTDSQLNIRMGEPVPPWAVWSQVTRNFAQFRYHHVERVTPCACEQAQPFINSHQGSCILPGFRPGDNRGVGVATLIERCFYTRKSFPCKRCGDPLGVTGERKIGQLPQRLVMTFDLKTRLRNHTQHLKFRYIDYEDKKQVAHYRWIGGIYNNEQHARVYWTDSKRGEEDKNDIQMYDSQLNQGIIFGGVPAFKPEDRVPLEWVNQSAIPLLFYERILDPSRDLLASAHSVVYSMGNMLGRKENVLEAHVPWAPSAPRQPEEPWDRVLSAMSNRFADFNPNWKMSFSNPHTPPLTTSAVSNVDRSLVDPSVVDPSLLEPSIYSNTTAPIFDINSLLDQSMMTEEENDQVVAEKRPENQFKNHMFGSMLDTPDWLSSKVDLWPSGLPSVEGALEFPNLPTWPSPVGRRKQMPISDICMPDADEYPLTGRLSEHIEDLKTAVIVNQTIGPKQRAAYASKLERQELEEHLRETESRWWAEKHRKDMREQVQLFKEQESEQQRQERKLKEYEMRTRRKQEAELQEVEAQAAAKRAEDERKRTRTHKPPELPWNRTPDSPRPRPLLQASPMTVDRTIKVRSKGLNETFMTGRQHVLDDSRVIEGPKSEDHEEQREKGKEKEALKVRAEAEALRQAQIDEREAKQQVARDALTWKPASIETMRRRRAEEELGEERNKKKKGKRKEDDPAWCPGGPEELYESDSE